MNTEALRQLRRVLQNTDRFDPLGWTSCAGGLACDDPWFIERGLRRDSPPKSKPIYAGCELGVQSLMNFFGLEWNDAKFLFATDATLQGALSHIDKLLDSGIMSEPHRLLLNQVQLNKKIVIRLLEDCDRDFVVLRNALEQYIQFQSAADKLAGY